MCARPTPARPKPEARNATQRNANKASQRAPQLELEPADRNRAAEARCRRRPIVTSPSPDRCQRRAGSAGFGMENGLRKTQNCCHLRRLASPRIVANLRGFRWRAEMEAGSLVSSLARWLARSLADRPKQRPPACPTNEPAGRLTSRRVVRSPDSISAPHSAADTHDAIAFGALTLIDRRRVTLGPHPLPAPADFNDAAPPDMSHRARRLYCARGALVKRMWPIEAARNKCARGRRAPTRQQRRRDASPRFHICVLRNILHRRHP